MRLYRIGAALLAISLTEAPLPGTGGTGRVGSPVVQPFPSVVFEPNLGQTDPGVLFLTRTRGMTVFFTRTETVLLLHARDSRQSVVRMKLAGANLPLTAEGLDRLPGVSNYYIGNDPSAWRSGVPQYGKMIRRGVYNGIDMACYGTGQNLEYDLIAAPGTDVTQVRLDWDGIDSMTLNRDGDLELHTPVGDLVQKRPRVYQQSAAGRVEVAAHYAIGPGHRVAFSIGQYDRSRPLIIDPQLIYATYLGGNGFDWGYAVATDASGAAYVAGATSSPNFPLVSPLKTTQASQDAFVSKFSASGQTLLYSTYLGGNGNDSAFAIAVDNLGAAYVTGDTSSSSNFPVLSGFQPAFGGGFWDAFVTKLSTTGALAYSTYLGGNGTDEGHGIAVDLFGDAFVGGFTTSTTFPVQSAYQSTNKGSNDSFVTALAPSGSSLLYSTYLGGSQDDQVRALAVDIFGAAYVTGSTDSTDYPTTAGSFQTASKSADVFITKLSPSGAAVEYSTYLGGSISEHAYAIAVDSYGYAYVAGDTISADFPIVGGYQTHLASNNYDVFVAKLTPTGNALVYSTYLGGTGTDEPSALTVDASGSAYVAGWTNSPDFPTLHAVQSGPQGADDAFVFKLSQDGSALVYSTYLGGTNDDYAAAIAVAPSGAASVVGWTESTDFVNFMPFQGNQVSTDAFVALIEPELLPADKARLVTPAPGSTLTGGTVTFTWTSAPGAIAYGLGVGTSQGNENIFDQEVGLATSQTVSGIPTDGSPIWVRVVTQQPGSIGWNDYMLTAFRNGNKAVMVSPAQGSFLAGSAVTFTWMNGTGSNSTQLDIGTAVGLGDLFSQNEALGTSQAVTGLPIDGSTLYVRLTTNIGTLTFFNDYTYSTGITLVPCDIHRDGFLDIVDAQQILNELIGITPLVDDPNHDGSLNVVDFQIVIGGIMGQGCLTH